MQMKCQLRTKNESNTKTIVEDWGALTWLASTALTGSDITVGRVVIKPDRSNPRHCHDDCEEVLYLLRGKLRHSFGDETIEMTAGDTLVVPPGVMHNAINTGNTDADMIVAYSSGKRDFRRER
jgi:quercetin dioxygenase-like cupin family protein